MVPFPGPMPRVLVAEDDVLIRRLLQQTLELDGFEVVTAIDGADAIGRMNTAGPFDVVVTDYAMPKANGIDVIGHSQRLDPSVPCIIVTAFRDLELAMQGMQAGAVGFIPKPFKAQHLRTVVRSALERRQLTVETVRLRTLAPMLERFTMLLANIVESRDVTTQRHSERLVEFAEAIAMALNLSPEVRGVIRLGGCLHDIGKVGVPEHLLTKPSSLTAAENAIMRRHPEIGAAILEDIDTWQDVRLIVRHHHERFDGTGYPDQLRGEEIPIGARVVAVADAFDVMRSGRIYSPAREFDDVVAELQAESGSQFDPDVVAAFLTGVDARSPGGSANHTEALGRRSIPSPLATTGDEPLADRAPRARWLLPTDSPARRERA